MRSRSRRSKIVSTEQGLAATKSISSRRPIGGEMFFLTAPFRERLATTHCYPRKSSLGGACCRCVTCNWCSIVDGYQTGDVCVAVHEKTEIRDHHFFPALESLINPAKIGRASCRERV